MLELVDQYRPLSAYEKRRVGSCGVARGEVVEVNDLAAMGSRECLKQRRLADGASALEHNDRLIVHAAANHREQSPIDVPRQDGEHLPRLAEFRNTRRLCSALRALLTPHVERPLCRNAITS